MRTISRMVLIAIVLIANLVAACAAPLPAQTKTKKEKREEAAQRGLQGHVTDPDDKPVTGAVVQLKDMRTLQVRSFITQEDGSYHFSGLKIDNDYQVKADFNGMTSGPKTLSVFDERRTPVINLKLEKK